MEAAVHIRALEREVHIGGDVAEVGHDRDLLALHGELLGQRDAHVVAVVVDDHDAIAGHLLTVPHDLLGREDVRLGGVRAGDRVVRCSVQTVGRPVAACGDDYDLGAVALDAVSVELCVGDELDVLQLVDLDLAVVDDPGPLAQAG